ncbi:uncharacterized protein K489DRAFT_224168 [Dissoconium aciculare CBS 342.82]|uniref:Uncharacterized protein n=1 Tax=Dissoconium aciculare CBS 342.82 TaxID=1314786 RepID=A0A6J3M5B6_9PEZI|nr:uncharacterized protein K489DRAFT_224168 [Dissoconium aciculare CBS 342.82]KAF1823068.1 hypothetical protein K489DRAFT_224168 [Dissoconium aciculare CBS 342.82]
MVMELSLRSHDPAQIPNFVDMTKDANSISATNIIWPLWKVGDVEVSKMMYSRTLAFPESRRATTARATLMKSPLPHSEALFKHNQKPHQIPTSHSEVQRPHHIALYATTALAEVSKARRSPQPPCRPLRLQSTGTS